MTSKLKEAVVQLRRSSGPAKCAAVALALSRNVSLSPGRVLSVGMGSGSTLTLLCAELALLAMEKNAKVLAVATSFEAKEAILSNSKLSNGALRLADLAEVDGRLDVSFDGADEVDGKGNCLKGVGGDFALEKLVAASALPGNGPTRPKFILVVDSGKVSDKLLVKRDRVPIEVLPFSVSALPSIVASRLGDGVKFVPRRAASGGKSGLVISDNGNVIGDLFFFEKGMPMSPNDLEKTICSLPGVVETGLFANELTKEVVVGAVDGTANFFQCRL
jgi:ribose 5-phosphate isomerase A